MPVRDMNIGWLAKSIYIPAQSFQSQITGAFIGDGTPVFAEISSFDYCGVLLASTGTGINHVMRIPYDLDRGKQVRFRVWWSLNVTDADVETPTLTYALYTPPALLTDAATALDTVIPAYTFSATANSIEVTDFGIMNKNTITKNNEFIALKLICTFNTASNSEISLMGLEMIYSPRRTLGPERNIVGGRRLVTTAPFGTLLATKQEGL